MKRWWARLATVGRIARFIWREHPKAKGFEVIVIEKGREFECYAKAQSYCHQKAFVAWMNSDYRLKDSPVPVDLDDAWRELQKRESEGS